jgi:hypothetical protein
VAGARAPCPRPGRRRPRGCSQAAGGDARPLRGRAVFRSFLSGSELLSAGQSLRCMSWIKNFVHMCVHIFKSRVALVRAPTKPFNRPWKFNALWRVWSPGLAGRPTSQCRQNRTCSRRRRLRRTTRSRGSRSRRSRSARLLQRSRGSRRAN